MSNESVLYVHEGFRNPGDAIVFAAARALVNEHLDVLYEASICLTKPEDVDDLAKPSGPDYIILTGAPWIWENCTASDKYRALTKLFSCFPSAKRVAVGIGTSFLLQHDLGNPGNLKQSLGAQFSETWCTFQTIIVRDVLALRILESVGIEAILLPCPSLLLSQFTARPNIAAGPTQNHKWVIFDQDLRDSFIVSYLGESFLTEFQTLTRSFREKGARIIAWDDAAWEEGSVRPPKSIAEIVETMYGLAGARFFTARVHAALTAISFGLNGRLFPIDSRALTAMHGGCKLVGPYGTPLTGVFKTLGGRVFTQAQALNLYRSHFAQTFGSPERRTRAAILPWVERFSSAVRGLRRRASLR